jgi:hypothetical protein
VSIPFAGGDVVAEVAGGMLGSADEAVSFLGGLVAKFTSGCYDGVSGSGPMGRKRNKEGEISG